MIPPKGINHFFYYIIYFVYDIVFSEILGNGETPDQRFRNACFQWKKRYGQNASDGKSLYIKEMGLRGG